MREWTTLTYICWSFKLSPYQVKKAIESGLVRGFKIPCRHGHGYKYAISTADMLELTELGFLKPEAYRIALKEFYDSVYELNMVYASKAQHLLEEKGGLKFRNDR